MLKNYIYVTFWTLCNPHDPTLYDKMHVSIRLMGERQLLHLAQVLMQAISLDEFFIKIDYTY